MIIEERVDHVTPFAATALARLLGRRGPAFEVGDELPIVYHWLAFLGSTGPDELQADGHRRPVPELRGIAVGPRMFAGSLISRSRPIRVGETVTKVTDFAGFEDKAGSSGGLRFVRLDSRLLVDGEAALVERQTIMHRLESPTRAADKSRPARNTDPIWEVVEERFCDETLLFRFSALTYNAHRIHYDRRFATEVEGHRDLVVQGPLQAALLADAAERLGPGSDPVQFRFRSVAPAYGGRTLRIACDQLRGDPLELAALDEHGGVTTTATAWFGNASQQSVRPRSDRSM